MASFTCESINRPWLLTPLFDLVFDLTKDIIILYTFYDFENNIILNEVRNSVWLECSLDKRKVSGSSPLVLKNNTNKKGFVFQMEEYLIYI